MKFIKRIKRLIKYVFHRSAVINNSHGFPIYRDVFVNKVTYINTPSFFRTVFDYFGDSTKLFVTVYGQDKEIWKDALLGDLDEQNFPKGLLTDLDPNNRDNMDGLLDWKKEL